MDRTLFLYLASILPLGIAAQWIAWRFRLPSILILLALGFLLGEIFDIDAIIAHAMLPQSFGDVDIQAEKVLFPFVSLAVAVIMFEGGMTLRLRDLREAGRGIVTLCTVGAMVTWGLASLAAVWALDMNWRIAVLLGAILVVTGPTVIGPLLRHVRPSRRVASIAKWEGIVVDPIGAVLAVLVFTALVKTGTASEAAGAVTIAIIKTIAIGGAMGLLSGWLMVQLVERYMIPDFLQNTFFLATVLGGFAVSNFLQPESGLVTVTLMGLYVTNQRRVALRHVMEFKENLQVLLVSSLFIVLGSRIRLEDILNVGWGGVLFVGLLIVVVRPISVLIGTLGSELDWREKAFLSLLAPRGIVAAAVTSIFALEIAMHSDVTTSNLHADLVEEAARLVPVMFCVIVVTVAFYGLLAAPLARWLGLARPSPQGILFAGADSWITPIAKAIHDEGYRVILVDTNYDRTAQARMMGLDCVCASILSDYLQEELELASVGRLLAVTPNDEVNALAVQEFSPIFGRAEVYQISPWDVREGRRTSVSGHLRGRLLFGDNITNSFLARRHLEGYVVKKTALTNEFTYENYRAQYGESAINLFVIRESGELVIRSVGDKFKFVKGQKLISLVPSSALLEQIKREEASVPRPEKLDEATS